MNTWIFQSGTIEWDIEKELFQNKIVQWTINRYENEIILGDRAIIWRSESDRAGCSGIIGKGKIIGQVIQNTIAVEIEELRFSSEEGMILKNILKDIPELQNLNIMLQDSASVFKVSDIEGSYIDNMWNSSNFGNVNYNKKIVNLNSSIYVDTLVENYCISKLGYLNINQINEEPIKNNKLNKERYPVGLRCINYWEEAQIYLVDEDLMDEIAPFKTNSSINMEYAKRILENFPNIAECKEEVIDGLWNRLIKNTSYMKVMGVYIEIVDDDLINKITREYSAEVRDGDAIFICPERVMRWCNNDMDRFHIAFCMILMHKLAHCYINFNRRTDIVYKNNHNEAWGKFFEESLANILAYKRFNGFEKSEIRKLILNKPTECRAFIYWISRDDIEIQNIALAWAHMDEKAMTNLLIDDITKNIFRNEFGQCGWKKISTYILKKII